LKTILHIIDTTGPGGAETVFIDLATRLPKDKYRSVVLIRGKGWVYEELCRRGVEPILLDAKGSFNFRYLLGLCKLIRREKVDLIQSHLLGASVYSSLAGLLTGTPVIATFHGAVDIGENERLKGLKFAAINRGSKRVIAVSGGLRDDILGRTPLSAAKTAIIYNGIQTSTFQHPRSDALRQKFGWGDEVFLIGSLGNIRPAKGYDILLQAAARLKGSEIPYRFVIAGQPDKGELYGQLLKLRKSLDLEDTVEFLGFIDDPAEFLANLDLFLSSSISEGLPLSAIQAMAAQLPLLATRCGGYEELVTDKVNGWLVEVGNPHAIAEAIEELAAKPDVRAKLAGEAKAHAVNTFDIKVMIDAYEELYEGERRIA
jgi:glycosyltransferase involved in cell wall biosynthesis